MTVKEALVFLADPKEVLLSWFGDIINFNFKSEFEVSAYANYEIQSICANGDGEFELVLAARPVIRGEETA